MKIVIFGLTISSSWGNGHATIWRGLCRALAQRGHRIVFFERNVPYYAGHRDVVAWNDGELVLYESFDDVRFQAQRQLADADVGIVTSYCPDALVATDLVLDSSAALRVFYDLDAPITLDALSAGQSVGYIGPGGLADFDLVLSYTGGRAVDELQRRLGARRVATLYGSVDPQAHRRVPPQIEFTADLSYLGTYAEDRQPALEELFIKPARRLSHRRFLIGGAQYPQAFPWSDNIYFVRHVDPPLHPAFYSSCRLTVNVTRRAMKDMGYCPSGRLFEAAACGTPILSDYWEGLEQFFEPNAEIIVARNSTEAEVAIEFSDTELAQFSNRARQRVLEEHTAEHRAREFEMIVATAGAPVTTRRASSQPEPLLET